MSPRAPGALLCRGGGEGTRVKGGEIERRVKMWVSINIFKQLAKAFSLNSFKNNVNEILATWLVI